MDSKNKYYCPCSNKSYKDYIAFYYHKLTKKHKIYLGELEPKPKMDIKERRKKYYNELEPEKKAALLLKIKEQSKARKEKERLKFEEELNNDEPVTIINIVKDDSAAPTAYNTMMKLLESEDKIKPYERPVIKVSKYSLKPNSVYKIHRCECGSIINKYAEKAHLNTKRHKFILDNLHKIDSTNN